MLITVVILILVALAGIVVFLKLKGGRESGKDGTEDPSALKVDSTGKKKHNPALEALRKYASKHSSNPVSVQQYATACFEAENYQAAFDAYSDVLKLTDRMNPEHVPSNVDVRRCRIRKGLCAIHIRKYDDAFKIISDVFAAKKELDGELLWALGVCEYYRKKYDRAAHYLTFVIKGFPDNIEAYRYLGMSYYKMNRYTETSNVLQQILAHATKAEDKELIFVLADAYHHSGKKDNALKLFRYLRTDPTYGPAACLSSGSINAAEGRYALAIADFETGLSHANMRTELMLDLKYSLAQTCIQNKDLRKAMELFQQVRAVNPSFKSVSQEIQKYGEKAASVHIITYLKSSVPEFTVLIRKFLPLYFGKTKVQINNIIADNSIFADVLALARTGNQDEEILQIRFYRTEATITEVQLRELYQSMKSNHAERGYCFTIATFSPEAHEFVEHRLIDLCGKDSMMSLFSKIP